MAQKSLPNLNKVNTSMIWYSTFYNKHYKWLSSQSLYFLIFFNKLTVYLDLFFFNLFWVIFEKTTFHYGFKKFSIFKKHETRFFKPVTSYLVNTSNANLVFNIYYKTSLERFQEVSFKLKVNSEEFGVESHGIRMINKLFFINNN